ncbi:P-loop containing nucleoside triphosphate hydrolase protein [Dentipellis sp. KUC8613]|nr:P-loop containing nucleoside triphosphate hydrolase protein [Dentipellis sp. KUC8613]
MSTPNVACRDSEGWGPVSRLRDFDLTPCFEEGIVLPTILLVLGFVSVFRVWSLRRVPPFKRQGKLNVWLLRLKIVFGALAAMTSFVNLVIVLALDQHVFILQTYILEVLALSLVPFLSYRNHMRTRRSSSIQLIFWPIYSCYSVMWSRTILSRASYHIPSVLVLKWCAVGLGLSVFILECLGPEYRAKLLVDGETPQTAENPLLTANLFSLWSFGWLTPLVRKGVSQYITEGDLPPLLASDESAKLGDDLKQALEKHRSLWMALFTAYGGRYITAAMLKLIQDCLSFLQPQLLRLFLSYISAHKNASSEAEGFMIILTMFVAAVAQSIIVHQYFQRCFDTGMRVRAGLITAIYKKSLVLSSDERGRASGDILNLMSVDATRMQDLCTYGLMAISGPLQITLAFISLYNLLGWSAFVGVAIMIISIPLNTIIARYLKKLQEGQMKNRDRRTRLMSELLSNIRSIKLYAWENAFIRRILFVRNDLELQMLRKIAIFTALNSTLWTGIPLLVAFSSFATAALTLSRPLTADVIFPAIALFNLLQFPLAVFAQVTSNIIEALVSVKRLSAFLRADELQSDARRLIRNPNLCDGDVVVELIDGEFVWNKEAPSPILEGVNMTVKKGELVGILGRVGAGKTSLLSAIIGEMLRVRGEVMLYGSLSYAPQNPWIMSATIKDNIMFYHEYDETFYNLVLDACALRPDLELMPLGDLTEVGERGITLSGGQRARISLARAIYARADLTLLDDVLAAVDSHVARHIFDQVIGPFGLLASKARILVTNNVSFVRQFDEIVYLRRGIIVESGSFSKLIGDNESELKKLIHGHMSSTASSGTVTPYTVGEVSTPMEQLITLGMPMEDTSLTVEKIEALSDKLIRKKSFGKANPVKKAALQIASGDGQTKEYSAQGRVQTTVYMSYIKAASKAGFALFLAGTILNQVLGILANVVLKSWAEHNQAHGSNGDAFKYLLVYGLLSLSSTIVSGLAAIFIWVLCSLRSSKQLHDSMLYSVIHAPLSFFELTPSGQIMNLFSRDVYVVDQVLARVVQSMFRTVIQCAGIVTVIGASFPAFLPAIFPLGWFYTQVMKYYLATSRELKRLDAVSRSPIFAWFSESLNGLSTIRAFNQQSIFIALNECRIDRNQICYLLSISVNRWLALRLEFLGSVIILLASSLAMGALLTSHVDAGLVGLVLTYALNMTSSLNWVVRSASEVEQNIVSVERILHYIKLESEAPYELPEAKPLGLWPLEGRVEFRNYSLKYRPASEPVLRDINLDIKPSEKVGVCGRTGAGKSSLLLALFRIIEPASGTIYIDGVDITTVGLYDLRSAISIVPQSPDLFEGTIRENIDPVGEHQDSEIWTAVTQSHLKEYVESLPGKLDAPVREGGSSLSAGQRQLICFARALLRKSKILVLDEATSAVDIETDHAIQEIIRGPQFADVTMLTIAHRLNTIVDSDRILVLDAGKVAEFDLPSALLDNPLSQFHSLAAEAHLI